MISSDAAVLRWHPGVSADSARNCRGAGEEAIPEYRAGTENSGKFLV
jgi:hypothetical protein